MNPKRRQICQRCGKRRPATKQVAHRKALDQPFEVFVLANGGLRACAICGSTKNLQRDHEHKGNGLVRGILCWRHNVLLSNNDWTPEMLRAAADYLERAERQRWINWSAFATLPAMSESPQQPQPQQDPNQDPQPAQQPDQNPQPAPDPGQPGQDQAPEQQPQPTTTQGG